MLLYKDGKLWGKRAFPPKCLGKFGWYENGPNWGDRLIDERFWRYRVGTESGDMSYIFKVQMNEAVIGIWSPDGDIEWRDDLNGIEPSPNCKGLV
jgi:hypothetical protein